MEIGGVSVTLALPWNYKGGLVTNGYVTLLFFPAGAIPDKSDENASFYSGRRDSA